MEYCRTDRFSMGSIVRSMGYKVLHRPVELAGLIGMWEGLAYIRPGLCQIPIAVLAARTRMQ
jgi:hypothetical protein